MGVVFSVIVKILNEKKLLKRPSDFIHSILIVIYVFLPNILNDLEIKFLNFFSWFICDLFLIFADLNLIYLGNHQLNCFLRCKNIFEEIEKKIKNEKIKFCSIIFSIGS